MLRVRRSDADFVVAGQAFAAGALTERSPRFVGDQRTTLGHAVTDGIGHLELAQDVLHGGIQGGAAHRNLTHLAAEGFHQFRTHLAVQQAPDPGNASQHFHRGLLQDGENLALDDLFHHQGHRDQDVGLDVGEGGHQRGGSGRLAQEPDMAAAAERIEELEGEAEHVGHRQH